MNKSIRILAIDVRASSFGFGVLEGSKQVLDWGVRSFRMAHDVGIPARQKFNALIHEFSPSIVVLRANTTRICRKRTRMRRVILTAAAQRGISARTLSVQQVKEAFAGSNRNKYNIASRIAKELPEIASLLPPIRKIWKSEDYRASIFDALGAGVAYLTQLANKG